MQLLSSSLRVCCRVLVLPQRTTTPQFVYPFCLLETKTDDRPVAYLAPVYLAQTGQPRRSHFARSGNSTGLDIANGPTRSKDKLQLAPGTFLTNRCPMPIYIIFPLSLYRRGTLC